MTLSTQTGASRNTPTLTAGKAVRLAIERNFRLLLLAAVVIGLGLVFNWSWLVAAGIAPVLLSVLPCLAMCALGLCMVGMRGRSCEAQPLGARRRIWTSSGIDWRAAKKRAG
ncbi:MAG TPA: hypothetical protein VMU56_06935 [Beijerinckiaceae bacterium]|nr:hypothetical protein [Beijerinckiaceae bacterium]HVB89191.1 hypothetical protein [Beijerinckiaceae bacterium]